MVQRVQFHPSHPFGSLSFHILTELDHLSVLHVTLGAFLTLLIDCVILLIIYVIFIKLPQTCHAYLENGSWENGQNSMDTGHIMKT